MPTFSTPEQRQQRTARAVDAATRAGQHMGLSVTEPEVLHDVFSVVVHLRPSDVVARVPVVLPPGRQERANVTARQHRELDVVQWLAQQDAPVVIPSPRVPAEPAVVDEFSITMWQYVDVEPDAEMDLVANASLVPRLHQVMLDYPRELPFLPHFAWFYDAFAYLDANPGIIDAGDLDRAQREWQALAPMVESPESLTRHFGDVEMQPLHGDAPAVNMLSTTQGIRYADFEDPALGPIEVDLAMIGPQAVEAYDLAAAELGMRRVNTDLLRLCEALGQIAQVACFAFVPDLPVLGEYLEPALEQWRDGPFAGGISK